VNTLNKRGDVMRNAKLMAMILFYIMIVGCQTTRPIHTVESVDLERFMGDWYVIASIPTFIEKDAYNALESYRLDPDGTIATTFSFNKGSPGWLVERIQGSGICEESCIQGCVEQAVYLAHQSGIPHHLSDR
jgi:lipocalin